MKVNGGCHCGHITYDAEVDPDKVFICHCTDCQVISGAAYRTAVRVDETNFRLLSGELKTYVRIADSGNERAQMFCPHCGAHIYATDTGDGPKTYGIRTGTVQQRDELPPKKQYWYNSALDWAQDISDLQSVPSQ
ncbi:MAG: GFA family protein [Rhodospirillales bacterium]|nr:GFA family protein [Rhodospirillales bacterium]